jgi:hypothetical protein
LLLGAKLLEKLTRLLPLPTFPNLGGAISEGM